MVSRSSAALPSRCDPGRRRKGWKRIFILDSFYETPQKKPKWLRINE